MQENDPFWEDPNTEVLIGTVHAYLQSLSYLIELEETLRISDFKGNDQGKFMRYFVKCWLAKFCEFYGEEDNIFNRFFFSI